MFAESYAQSHQSRDLSCTTCTLVDLISNKYCLNQNHQHENGKLLEYFIVTIIHKIRVCYIFILCFSLYVFGGFGNPTQGYLHEHGDFYVDTNTWVSVTVIITVLIRPLITLADNTLVVSMTIMLQMHDKKLTIN